MTAEKKFTIAAAWTLLTIGGWSLLHPALQADEKHRSDEQALIVDGPILPQPVRQSEEKCPACQWRTNWTTGCAPVLSRIPGLARLFAPAECEHATLERIGIDFDGAPFSFFFGHGECTGDGSNPSLTNPAKAVDQFIFFAPPTSCACLAACGTAASNTTACGTESTPACTATAGCSTSMACKTEELPATVAVPWKEKLVASSACTESDSCHGHTCVTKDSVHCQLRSEQLIGENAALHAALDAKDELMEAHSEMLEEMIGIITEKVELQCRLAATEKVMAERERFYVELSELRSENSRLKSLAETMEVKHTAEKVQLEMAAENERLKLRVAELERHADTVPVSARTAKRAAGKKVR